MKKLLATVLLVGGLVWIGDRNRMLPFQARFDALMGRPSPAYAAFQDFATAFVLGQMESANRFIDADELKNKTSRAYLDLRRMVDTVHTVRFRLESERPAAGGASVALTVSQGLTIDPPGVHSGFGTLSCEGTYDVTMDQAAGAWHITALSLRAPATQPAKRAGFISFAGENDQQVDWPCADSPWTSFAATWKERILGGQ